MAAATMDHLRQLYGQPRDGYTGTTPPTIAAPRDPVRVVHMRRSGNAVLIAIRDGNRVETLVVTSPDDTRLQAFGSDDRSRVHSALAAIGQEADDAA